MKADADKKEKKEVLSEFHHQKHYTHLINRHIREPDCRARTDVKKPKVLAIISARGDLRREEVCQV